MRRIHTLHLDISRKPYNLVKNIRSRVPSYAIVLPVTLYQVTIAVTARYFNAEDHQILKIEEAVAKIVIGHHFCGRIPPLLEIFFSFDFQISTLEKELLIKSFKFFYLGFLSPS